jgi:hypothetical protein
MEMAAGDAAVRAMNPNRDPRDPSSKKGWVKLGYDRRIWIPAMATFPDGLDRDGWAAGFAQEWWDGSGLDYTPNDVARLTAQLAETHRATFGHLPCHLAFVHLPDPRLIPLTIFLGVFESGGERGHRLRVLTHADDPDAVEPPIVDEFHTEKLGTGLRTLRYLHLDDGALYAALNYAWRSDEYETDLRLWTATEDLARLERAMPDIDEFARTIAVVSRAGLVEM